MRRFMKQVVLGALAFCLMIPAMSLDAKAETVANYGGQGYDSFEAAFEAAQRAGGDATIEIVGDTTIENKEHALNGNLVINGNAGATLSVAKASDDVPYLFTGHDVTIDANNLKVDGQGFTGVVSGAWMKIAWNTVVTDFQGGFCSGGAAVAGTPSITNCSTSEEFLFGTEYRGLARLGNDNNRGEVGEISNCGAAKAIYHLGHGQNSAGWINIRMKDNESPYDVYVTEARNCSIGCRGAAVTSKKILFQHSGLSLNGAHVSDGKSVVEIEAETDPTIGATIISGNADSYDISFKSPDLNTKYKVTESEGNAVVKGIVTVDGQEYTFGKDQLVKAKSDKDVTWKVNGDAVAYGKSFFWTPQPGDKITTEEVKSELVPYTSVETDSSFLVSVPESGDYDFKVKAADGTYGNITGLHLDADTQYRVTIDNMGEKTLEEVGVIKKNQA